jgi:hypothetical protein
MVSISGKPDLSADGADRVIAAAEPLYADLRWGLAAGFFAPVFLPAIGSSMPGGAFFVRQRVPSRRRCSRPH